MGRTVPSFRILLEGIIGELSDFRRALRGEDRLAFDSLMNKARVHASSCTVVPTLDPMEGHVLVDAGGAGEGDLFVALKGFLLMEDQLFRILQKSICQRGLRRPAISRKNRCLYAVRKYENVV